MNSYDLGFIEKCAQYGIDPNELIKQSQAKLLSQGAAGLKRLGLAAPDIAKPTMKKVIPDAAEAGLIRRGLLPAATLRSTEPILDPQALKKFQGVQKNLRDTELGFDGMGLTGGQQKKVVSGGMGGGPAKMTPGGGAAGGIPNPRYAAPEIHRAAKSVAEGSTESATKGGKKGLTVTNPKTTGEDAAKGKGKGTETKKVENKDKAQEYTGGGTAADVNEEGMISPELLKQILIGAGAGGAGYMAGSAWG